MSGNQPTGGRPGPTGRGPSGPGFGQPSGPGYGPGGYPGQGGPYGPGGPQQLPPQGPGRPSGPYGPMGPGQPGGAYGGPGGPMGPGGPGQPQGPGGPMGPGGPGQPGGKPGSKLLLIMGGAVLALILLVVGAVALFNRGSGNAATPPAGGSSSTSSGGGGSQSEPPTTATKPSDAVRAYLQALAAGKAATALALGSEQPADKTFLTDAVLAASNKRAPITNINVPEVTSAYTYDVDASYKLGNQPVTDKYTVTKSSGSWKVQDSFVDMDLKYLRNDTLPLLLNGVAVKTDKVRLFPGSYAFTSNNSYIDYGSDNVVLLKSPSDYASTTDVKPTLTAAGAAAFKQTVETKLVSCAKSKALLPAGCPNGVTPYSYQKVDKGSVTWKFDKSSLDNLRTDLDYQNPAVAKSSGTVDFQFSATGKNFDQRTRFAKTVTVYPQMSVNMTQHPLTVVFSN